MKILLKTNSLIDSKMLIFIFSIFCHLISVLLFQLNTWTIPVKSLFSTHLLILISISILITIGIFIYKKKVPIITLLILKLFLLYLIGYPLDNYIGLELFLFTSLIVETGILLPHPYNLWLTIIFNIFFLLSQRNVSAWWYSLSSLSIHDLVFTGFFAFSISAIILFLSYNISERKKREIKIERLDSAISQLTDANIGFQKYVKFIEMETITNERKRLSREIHDAVGYSLTNIIMLLEAAALLVGSEEEQQKNAILNAKKQAINGLDETRTALRHLRENNIESMNGIRAIDEMIKAFRDATGIKIKVEYGNLPFYTNDLIDALIFRMIQEGMTNAFRHGMATKITIIFWYDNNLIRLFINDNGNGTSEIVEGIGIAGMRERLEKIDGKLIFKNVVDGFELGAEIPWFEEKV